MPTLHVCSLARLADTVAATGASHVVTLINVGTAVERPAAIDVERHLTVELSDIVEPMDGHVLPGEEHVRRLIAFARAWDREKPLVIHCFAGISRSTAGAYIVACALKPERDEAEIARGLRRVSAVATPNRLLVEIADRLLGRDGRMVRAIREIGRGTELVAENEPFSLALD